MDRIDRIQAQWRAERPDLQLRPMGLMGRMKRLSTHLGQGLETVFSQYGLNSASFDVLATLRRAGAPFALTPTQLIDWTMVTSGTMTNRLDRLEQQGLIRRLRSAADARSVTVQLTPEGLELIDRCVEAHVTNQHRLTEALTVEEQEQLSRLLAKWLRQFEADQNLD